MFQNGLIYCKIILSIFLYNDTCKSKNIDTKNIPGVIACQFSPNVVDIWISTIYKIVINNNTCKINATTGVKLYVCCTYSIHFSHMVPNIIAVITYKIFTI